MYVVSQIIRFYSHDLPRQVGRELFAAIQRFDHSLVRGIARDEYGSGDFDLVPALS